MRRLATIAADWLNVAVRWPRSILDRTPPDAYDNGDRVPVIVLPGIWEPWRFMLPLAKVLHAEGHPIYPVPGLRLNGAPLDASAEKVAEALSEHDAPRVVLVAHSKGGLVGKQLMLHPKVGHRVAGLVALCSPFGGSTLSLPVLARTPLGLFSPANSALTALAAEQAVNAKIVSIGSSYDEMVPNGTHLEGARNITLEMAGHFRPLVSPSVQQLVLQEVRRFDTSPDPGH
jgi:pimeloyl-ACP methyl ester carboxylesterase